MSAPTVETEPEHCHGEQLVEHCDHPEHTLPMATLAGLMAQALTCSEIVDGHLVRLATEVRNDGHLVVEATTPAHYPSDPDPGVRVVLHVSAAEPITAAPPPPIEGDDEVLPCGCFAGFCYCDDESDDRDPAACWECGQLDCECPAVEVGGGRHTAGQEPGVEANCVAQGATS